MILSFSDQKEINFIESYFFPAFISSYFYKPHREVKHMNRDSLLAVEANLQSKTVITTQKGWEGLLALFTLGLCW